MTLFDAQECVSDTFGFSEYVSNTICEASIFPTFVNPGAGWPALRSQACHRVVTYSVRTVQTCDSGRQGPGAWLKRHSSTRSACAFDSHRANADDEGFHCKRGSLL